MTLAPVYGCVLTFPLNVQPATTAVFNEVCIERIGQKYVGLTSASVEKNASTTQTRQRIPRTRDMWQDIRMDEVGKLVALDEHVEWVCLMMKHYSSRVMILLAYCRTKLTSGLFSVMLIYMCSFYLYVL